MACECEPPASVRRGGDTGPAIVARNNALSGPGLDLEATSGRSERYPRPSAFLRAQLAGDGVSAAARATLERYYRNWIVSDSSRIAYRYDHQLREVDGLLARLAAPGSIGRSAAERVFKGRR